MIKSPPFTHSVPLLRSLHWLPLNLKYCSRSVCWPTKGFMKNSLFIFTPCLPYHSHLVHWYPTKKLVCWSLGSRPAQAQELFTLVPPLFQTASRSLSFQLFHLLPSTNISRHISLSWTFSRRHRRPVDVTELFHRFCCWTPSRLSRHWAWLCRGYWRYRNFIDLLIETVLIHWLNY